VDTLTLPEDLTQLSADDIADLTARITDRAQALQGAEAEWTAADVAEAEQLAEAFAALNSETGRRAEEAAQVRQSMSSALGSILAASTEFADLDGDGLDDETGEPVEPVEEDEGEEEEPVEMAAAPAAPEPVVAAARRVEPVRVPGARQQLTSRRPRTAAPRVSTAEAFFAATKMGLDPEGTRYRSLRDIADAITRKRLRFGTIPQGVSGEQLSIAVGSKSTKGPRLGRDPQANFGVLTGARDQHLSLVASGGYSAPLAPIYEFFTLARPQTPVEDFLASANADRGGIRYIPGTDMRVDARQAVDTYTKADAETTEPELVVKTKFKVAGPTTQDAYVDAVTSIVDFDNLEYRVFPELVEAFLDNVAIAFAETKERYYLDVIRAGSTDATSAVPYGPSRGVLWDWTTASVNYRKRHGMGRNDTIEVIASDWVSEAIKLDIAMGHSADPMARFNVTDADVDRVLAARNLRLCWANDVATSDSAESFRDAQGAGALNAWPTQTSAYVAAPGTWVRLDGGTLDLGLVRDSTLNGTNDLQLFAEEWIGCVKLGIESVEVISTLMIPAGQGPDTVAVYEAPAP
jgi:hypothetical protein